MTTNCFDNTFLRRYYELFLSKDEAEQAVRAATAVLPRFLPDVVGDNDQWADFMQRHPQLNRALLFAMRYGQVCLEQSPLPLCQATNTEVTQRFARARLASAQQEHVCVMPVDAQSVVIGWEVVAIGTLTQVVMAPRDIVRRLLQHNVDHFILVHNHPSGHVTPSLGDRAAITSIATALRAIGLTMLDAMIVSPGKSLSFQESNLL